MSSSASSATWLPAAIARAAVLPSATSPARPGRHRAPEHPGVERIATPAQLARQGRHAPNELLRLIFEVEPEDRDGLNWLDAAAR